MGAGMIVIYILLAIFGIMTLAAVLNEVIKPTCFGLFVAERECCTTCANKQACYIESRKSDTGELDGD